MVDGDGHTAAILLTSYVPNLVRGCLPSYWRRKLRNRSIHSGPWVRDCLPYLRQEWRDHSAPWVRGCLPYWRRGIAVLPESLMGGGVLVWVSCGGVGGVRWRGKRLGWGGGGWAGCHFGSESHIITRPCHLASPTVERQCPVNHYGD